MDLILVQNYIEAFLSLGLYTYIGEILNYILQLSQMFAVFISLSRVPPFPPPSLSIKEIAFSLTYSLKRAREEAMELKMLQIGASI